MLQKIQDFEEMLLLVQAFSELWLSNYKKILNLSIDAVSKMQQFEKI